MDIEIRQATIEDIPEITTLFRDTVREVNSKHYSDKQIQTWSAGASDTQKWEERIHKCYFLVAESHDIIVGFAYLKNGNYFDGLFVHKDYQRQGIASKLLRIIESKVMMDGFGEIKSDVSITALPFFENHYFDVIKKQKKVLKGMTFENYIVSKAL
ncbi:GNAT family N-acetyltransferase [Hanstruepera neustonica]|uniref:GNAT family N-acetyltransferase n=1 Tax=Hanstruepera neustonica TaxID=1445657 RepID=A0A2K1E0D6_9FLAO|nr:GNAT family N-acetyltransferase [Hanstruepera neustonica]PNQ73738.1 GNAT family N-acetyltransferase [Hanstruepera neustonica]